MKKVILFVMMCVCALSAYALENAKCYLEHNGNVTTYDASAIATAIEAAVKGDILYLGEGQYPGFTLDKEITVRGAGSKTVINGSAIIKIAGNPELKQDLLIGLCINNLVSLESQMTGVSIKQCWFYNFDLAASNENIVIEKCHIANYFYMRNYIQSLFVTNSKIGRIYTYYAGSPYYTNHYTENNVSTFLNCNIENLYNYDENWLKGTFVNCIINGCGYASSSANNSNGKGYLFGNCTFVNSLFHWDIQLSNTSTKQECYVDTKFTMENLECSYDTETLTAKGYLGNDGTVVGIYGGSNPFTLDLNLPRITTSKIALDRENKVLNVNLKVTKN